ncbi:MAG: hypothetical protein HQP61_06850 [Peptococcaceae bacterium]|nr:hypothetical protein [Candidatus Syntrophopropionicum ammoniitolerans]
MVSLVGETLQPINGGGGDIRGERFVLEIIKAAIEYWYPPIKRKPIRSKMLPTDITGGEWE